MAYRIKNANGAWTAADWAACDATFFLDSEAQNTAVPAAWTGPAAGQTPGAITIDGVAVKVHSRVASPTGTLSLRVYNVTGAAVVANTTVTINASDIPSAPVGGVGWLFFKFAAPVALAGATAYRVEVQCSVASEVTLYRDGTANNWSKLVRTTTAAAAAAGDNLFILKEWTAAATGTARSTTMDQTATTDYGDGTENALAKIGIGHGCTVTWGTTAATAYRLRCSGYFVIWAGGTMTMGTVATPMPRDSTAELQFDVVTTNYAFGLINFGTFTAQGLSRTSGKDVWECNLNATTLAGSPTWNVDTDTGWLNGDEVAIAHTRATAAQTERMTLNGAAGAASFTTTANAANAHDGTGNVPAKVLLITRNVRITNVTTTKVCFGLNTLSGGVTDCDWVLFQRCGGSGTGALNHPGIEGTGQASFEYCFLGDNTMAAALAATEFLIHALYAGFSGTLTVQHCGLGINAGTSGIHTCFATVANANAGLATITVNDVVYIGGQRSGGTETFVSFGQVHGNWTNIEVWSSAGTIFNFTTSNTRRRLDQWSFTNVSVYSVTGTAIVAIGAMDERIALGVLNVYRTGCTIINHTGYSLCSVEGGTWIGFANVQALTLNSYSPIRLRNVTAKGETGYVGTYLGAQLVSTCFVRLENCVIGGAGANENFATGVFGTNSWSASVLELINTVISGATFITNFSTNCRNMTLRYQRAAGVSNDHYVEYPDRGYVRREVTTFRTAAPSEKLTPVGSIASNSSPVDPLRSSVRKVAVRSGFQVAISVWVRKDGTYNGTAPRLICAANPAIGHDNEVVLDTHTAAADAWEELTGTVPSATAEEDGMVSVWVAVDGTAGNVYVDDWSAAEV